jgi:hypothetical protein
MMPHVLCAQQTDDLMKKQSIIVLIILFAMQTGAAAQGKFYGGNGDGFASAVLNNIVLPLPIHRFTAEDKGNEIVFFLEGTGAENLQRIFLERSTDGINYKGVDSISAFSGNASLSVTLTEPAPLPTLSFYRAVIKDRNGSIAYTHILKLRQQQNTTRLRLRGKTLYYETGRDGFLQIINTSGQLVKQYFIKKGAGSLEINTLAPGIFFIKAAEQPPVLFFVQ